MYGLVRCVQCVAVVINAAVARERAYNKPSSLCMCSGEKERKREEANRRRCGAYWFAEDAGTHTHNHSHWRARAINALALTHIRSGRRRCVESPLLLQSVRTQTQVVGDCASATLNTHKYRGARARSSADSIRSYLCATYTGQIHRTQFIFYRIS